MAKRSQLKAPHSDHLRHAMENLDVTQKGLGDLLGVGPTTITRWLKTNDVPLWTLLLCERLRDNRPKTKVMIVAAVPVDEKDFVKRWLESVDSEVVVIEL